jgi:4-carboxymuconolactone decarboxylase
MDDKARYERGLTQRRKVLGDGYVERSLAARTEFNSEFQEIITLHAWGEIWTRPHFDERTRRILVIGTLMALDKWEEFRLHVRVALTEGGFSADGRNRRGTRQDLSQATGRKEPTGQFWDWWGGAISPRSPIHGAAPDGGLQRSQGNAGCRAQQGRIQEAI